MTTEKPKKPKDPFLPPLDEGQAREFFRRLAARPQAEQEAFVKKVNWNLVDAGVEHRLMGWLLTNLASGEPSRQAFVFELLEKLPHFRRGKFAPRFAPLLKTLEPAVATRLAATFGPVLGGPPKRSGAKKPTPAPAPVPDREATSADLEKLQSFFNKFGGAK